MPPTSLTRPVAIEHPGEDRSNDLRRQTAQLEPRGLRTKTPSMAVIAKSAGSYHWTPEGRRLADFTSGVLVANLGHNPASWWARVDELLGRATAGVEGEYLAMSPLTSYNAISELEVEASRRLIANLRAQPGGQRMETVAWSASGSEAIQKALWAALAHRPGRDVILATRRGFHGKKGLANAVTGDEHCPDRDPRVRFIGFPHEECLDVQRRREPLDLSRFRQELESIAATEGDRLCCLITEPYLGGGGSYHPQPEYLQLLQQFCREHDLLFLLDEVQSNFGRTGAMYAFTHYGLEPDVVILGKGLGNGIPVAAAVGPAEVFGSLTYGELSDTFSGNPLSAAAVIATLDAFETSDIVGQGRQLGELIERHLVRMQADLPSVARVRGEGSVWGIECAAVGELSAEQVAHAAVAACYRGDAQGRAIHLLGPLAGRVIRISPPLTMPLDEAEQYLEVLYERFSSLDAASTRDQQTPI